MKYRQMKMKELKEQHLGLYVLWIAYAVAKGLEKHVFYSTYVLRGRKIFRFIDVVKW